MAEREMTACPLFQRLQQLIEVVIEQLEVIIESGLSAHGWVHHHYFCSGSARDEVGSLAIEIRLHEDSLHLLVLDLIDQLEGVAGRGRDARLRLDMIDNHEPEVPDEIW